MRCKIVLRCTESAPAQRIGLQSSSESAAAVKKPFEYEVVYEKALAAFAPAAAPRIKVGRLAVAVVQQLRARVDASGADGKLRPLGQKLRDAARRLLYLSRAGRAFLVRRGLEYYHLPRVGAAVYILRAEEPELAGAALYRGENPFGLRPAAGCGEEHGAARNVALVAERAQVRLRL